MCLQQSSEALEKRRESPKVQLYLFEDGEGCVDCVQLCVALLTAKERRGYFVYFFFTGRVFSSCPFANFSCDIASLLSLPVKAAGCMGKITNGLQTSEWIEFNAVL